MPVFSRNLDVYQGFNFKKDKQTSVGFLHAFGLDGTLALAADLQNIRDPENPEELMTGNVVAVLTHILWESGVTDAIYFSGQVSAANKQKLALAILSAAASVDTNFRFTIFDYDPIAKRYFKAMSVDAPLAGLLEKRGDELNLSVAEEPSSEVQLPRNYTFQAGVKPQSRAQTVHIATASARCIVKPWGVSVSWG